MPPSPYTTGPAGNWRTSADAQIIHNCAHSRQAITRTSNAPIRRFYVRALPRGRPRYVTVAVKTRRLLHVPGGPAAGLMLLRW
jgi:hypothetical protein